MAEILAIVDKNLLPTPMAAFARSYNENIPDSFPRATLKALREFELLHPSLFKKSHEWIIDRHRKKLMDWLLSYKG